MNGHGELITNTLYVNNECCEFCMSKLEVGTHIVRNEMLSILREIVFEGLRSPDPNATEIVSLSPIYLLLIYIKTATTEHGLFAYFS